MPARTRTRQSGSTSGALVESIRESATFTWYDKSYSSRNELLWEKCNDVVGNPHGDNPFFLERVNTYVSPIVGSGFRRFDPRLRIYFTEGYPTPNTLNLGARVHGWNNLLGSASQPEHFTAKTLARTNPNKPIVDLPVFIFELKDLPKMIRQVGRTIQWLALSIKRRNRVPPPTVTDLAIANLAYQFGWKPLIDDTLKLLDFVNVVEKKRRQLTSLYSKGGMRRNVTLLEISDTLNYGAELVQSSNQCTMYSTRSVDRIHKVWGSARWNPSVPNFGVTTPGEWETIRSAFGLDITMHTIWEALPWSWLIDWFTNAGDILAASRNTIPVTSSRCNIMLQWRNVAKYHAATGTNGYSWGGARTEYVLKRRTPFGSIGPLSASMPFLDAGQLSILGSLNIVMGKPRGGRWLA